MNNFEKLLQNFSSISKCDLNLNFKNSYKLLNILKNIKVLLSDNKLRNDDNFKVAAKVIDEFNQSKAYHKKLNELFGLFFENVDTMFRIKKLIWAVFIYLRCKLLFISNNFLERLHLFYKVTTLIITKVPSIYFPSSLKITDENKKEIVQTIIENKTKTEVKSFDYSLISNELPKNLDLSNSAEVQKQIDYFYKAYEEDYLQNKDIFDERILLCDIFKTDSSPMKANGYTTVSKPLPCARQLFSNGKEEKNIFPYPQSVNLDCKMNGTPVDMTPCTRAVSLENWAKNFISNFDPKVVIDLQEKYKPTLYNTNPEVKPIDKYIRKLLVTFDYQLTQHTTRIITTFEDITKMCLKFIYTLLQKDLMIFTEEFCAMLLYNEDYIKAIVAISMEIILFIEDIEEITFNRIPEFLGLDVYDLWKIMNPIQLRSIVFHKEIKDHLEEVEEQLLSFLIWRNPSTKMLKDIKEFFEEDNKNINKKDIEVLSDFEYKNQSLFLFHRKEDFEFRFYKKEKTTGIDIYMELRNSLYGYKYINAISILLRRIINYCNSLNRKIFEHLDSEYQTEAINSENLIKIILTSQRYITVLYGRHIDQFVISVIITILNSCQQFTFHQTQSDFELSFEIQKPKLTLAKLQDAYNKSKSGQVSQVSKMIFKKVKISDKKFSNMQDYYDQSFKVNFQSIINQLNIENDNVSTSFKKRKFSNEEEETKTNPNQEALQSKSAFSNKVDNYLPLQKKFHSIDIRNSLYGAFFNEFKSKRTQKLKELYPYLVKIESENFERLKINSSMDKILSFGFENSGKKFDFGGEHSLTSSQTKDI